MKDEILDIFNIYWNDNVKARHVNSSAKSIISKNNKMQSQQRIYNYYLNKIERI